MSSNRGDNPRRIDLPTPGFWAIRLAPGAVEVGAAILRVTTRPPDPAAPTNIQQPCNYLEAFLNGKPVPVAEVWERRARPISQSLYEWLVRDREWARAHAPHLPEARPHERADLRMIPAVMPPSRRR